ncbi:thermonuclease family protein [Sporosarcina sp. FSL K6-1508]|uniref:thermonuclease family protein n=1 Tax=Sporosarcina sp. FSL K6-1508 TaxID=2921553 RepID=UPI0030F73A6B
MKFFYNFLVLLCAVILTACSVPTDELSEEINKKVEEEVGKVVEKATQEGQKKVEEGLSVGKDKVDSILGDLLGSDNAQPETTAPANKIETGGTTEQIPVELISVIDGDTIKIRYDNKVINVRYLLLDTPEVTNGKNQPFGIEAKIRNKELLKSGVVSIEFDVGERMDKYGRLLAYVYIDKVNIGEILVMEGLARIAYITPPNTRYLETYEKAQDEAKNAGRGIWSIDNYSSSYGFKE